MSLDPGQRAAFERDGYLVLRAVLAADRVQEIAGWVDEVASWAVTDGPGLHHLEQTDTGPALARSEDLIGHHAGLRSLLTEGLVPELAGELLGEPALLYKEKVNYKHPGGAGFAAHQDAPAYRFVDFHVSCMLPLEPATEASGCLWVAEGRHREVLAMDGLRGLSDEVVASLTWHPVELGPGDLLWFDSYVPHPGPLPDLQRGVGGGLPDDLLPGQAGDLRRAGRRRGSGPAEHHRRLPRSAGPMTPP